MDYLSEIMGLSGKELKTLTKKQPFKVYLASEGIVEVTPQSTGKTRLIQMDNLQNALKHLLNKHELTQREIDNYYVNQNSSYTLAIIAKVTGATFFMRGNGAVIKLD